MHTQQLAKLGYHPAPAAFTADGAFWQHHYVNSSGKQIMFDDADYCFVCYANGQPDDKLDGLPLDVIISNLAITLRQPKRSRITVKVQPCVLLGKLCVRQNLFLEKDFEVG